MTTDKPKKRRIGRAILITLVVLILAVAIGTPLVQSLPPFGGELSGERLVRAKTNPHYHDGKFVNPLPPAPYTWPYVRDLLAGQFSGDEAREPPMALPLVRVPPTSLQSAAPGLRAFWIGHSSVYVEIDGVRLLIDPVFSDYASPFDFGPKRFHPPPIALNDLPKIDAVLITHDHYDHLDMRTVQHLAQRGALFLVPLGIGAHLERWGVPAAQRKELDWNERARLRGLELLALPSRHFSGRRGLDAYETLWATWAIVGPSHRVFFSGDTGWFDAFAGIGRTLGPFDLTVIKIGAYGPTWPDIHVNPEQAVAMHLAVRGKLLLPVHWGTFNLAYHDWNEPPERLIRAATGRIAFVLPRPGDVVDVRSPQPVTKWW